MDKAVFWGPRPSSPKPHRKNIKFKWAGPPKISKIQKKVVTQPNKTIWISKLNPQLAPQKLPKKKKKKSI
jgi:hypothetical protein